MSVIPAVPNGLEQIIATFGDLQHFIRENGALDPAWEQTELMNIPLPFPIPVSGFPGKLTTHIYGHKKLADIFPAVFADIQKVGLQDRIKTYGGCFCFRQKRVNSNLSCHSWGIAIDLNCETNAQGTEGDMDMGVVAIFRKHGFKWGGDWLGHDHDPEHFQFATGY